MNRGNPLSKDEWKACVDCKNPLGKWDNIGKDKIHCKHCYTKLKHGVVDINNCFQGSVITID